MVQSREIPAGAKRRIAARRDWPLVAILLSVTLAALAAAATLRNLSVQLPSALWFDAALVPDIDDMRQVLVHYAFLPRLIVSLLCGAALGLAGTVLQQVLRNPLASPETVGVSAGAYLALALATLFAPSLLAFGREWVALAGAFAALAAVLALSWHKGLSPLSVVLAGLVVSLYAGATGAALVVLNHEWLAGLFIWGAGSLGQQDWVTTFWLLPRLGIAALAIGLMTRPLTLLGLEDEGARSLGVPLGVYRFAGLGMAVALIAFVVAAVGVIGFVGLAAAAFARIGGARRFGQRLVVAPLIGAALLWAADQGVQLATGPRATCCPPAPSPRCSARRCCSGCCLASASALNFRCSPRSACPGYGALACCSRCWASPCSWFWFLLSLADPRRKAGASPSAINCSPCCPGVGRACLPRFPPAACWRSPG